MKKIILHLFLINLITFNTVFSAYATAQNSPSANDLPSETVSDNTNEFSVSTGVTDIEYQKTISPDSDTIKNWPKGPSIGAESACLIDVDTGTVIYSKNMDKIQYPASTTKVMTCLLAAENSSLTDIVTFSKTAVFGIERDSSNVGMDVGQSITMEEALYCVMLASANEVASAIAEHIAGSTEAFAEMMNKRAKELGCTNTHFVNANGLHNSEHYTTAHDLALITAAYFKNETLKKIASTTYYEVHATATQPDEFGISNHHKMLPNKQYAYEYLIGGKTGYTNMARQTLVSCAKKGDITLSCAVMRDEAPNQYLDTASIFNYGFENFYHLNISDNENHYNLNSSNFFQTNIDIFGNSKNIFSINDTDKVTLPVNTPFSECTSELTYSDDKEILADINYLYNNYPVGTGHILITNNNIKNFEFGNNPRPDTKPENDLKNNVNIIFVNAKPFLIGFAAIISLIFIIFIAHAILKDYHFSRKRDNKLRKRNRHYKSEFDDFDF